MWYNFASVICKAEPGTYIYVPGWTVQILITFKAVVQSNTPISNTANKKTQNTVSCLNLSYFFIFCNKKIDFQSIHDMEQSGTYNK